MGCVGGCMGEKKRHQGAMRETRMRETRGNHAPQEATTHLTSHTSTTSLTSHTHLQLIYVPHLRYGRAVRMGGLSRAKDVSSRVCLHTGGAPTTYAHAWTLMGLPQHEMHHIHSCLERQGVETLSEIVSAKALDILSCIVCSRLPRHCLPPRAATAANGRDGMTREQGSLDWLVGCGQPQECCWFDIKRTSDPHSRDHAYKRQAEETEVDETSARLQYHEMINMMRLVDKYLSHLKEHVGRRVGRRVGRLAPPPRLDLFDGYHLHAGNMLMGVSRPECMWTRSKHRLRARVLALFDQTLLVCSSQVRELTARSSLCSLSPLSIHVCQLRSLCA